MIWATLPKTRKKIYPGTRQLNGIGRLKKQMQTDTETTWIWHKNSVGRNRWGVGVKGIGDRFDKSILHAHLNPSNNEIHSRNALIPLITF